ncbi:hypothetical protein H5410_052518 [Solanum commersonii]|uniref:Alpha/beta hydrolase fold-3 domain-containing protein n=1 Tax=Solanum commersonii TaxID=4109 RepID=A0A9J5X1B2_SOLCO|nr:hypothetical protein H5410_052518 [Solanum commersonii]
MKSMRDNNKDFDFVTESPFSQLSPLSRVEESPNHDVLTPREVWISFNENLAGNELVIGLVAIQPFFGGEERTESELKLVEVDALISVRRTDWMWNAFLPPGEGMDPTMVVVGGFDPLKDWQKRYYEWLKRSGKDVHFSEYPTMVHAFYIFPEVPEATQLILEVKDFVNKQC